MDISDLPNYHDEMPRRLVNNLLVDAVICIATDDVDDAETLLANIPDVSCIIGGLMGLVRLIIKDACHSNELQDFIDYCNNFIRPKIID